MTLLSALARLQARYGFTLTAVHVHHGIRGAEADRDEETCHTVCERLGVPLEVRHVDIPRLAKESGESLEACGRRERYAFFREIAAEQGGEYRIATAHTMQDSAETFLFHLARGSGLDGLTGIHPVRGDVIHPLISCSREETETYCRECGLAYVMDSTNADLSYSRNRIRHVILPEMQKVNSAGTEHIADCMELLLRDADYLNRQAADLEKEACCPAPDGAMGLNAAVLAGADPALSSRVLKTVLTRESGVVPEQCHIEKLLLLLKTESGGQLQIPSGMTVIVRSGVLSVSKVPADRQADFPPFAEAVPVKPGTFPFPGGLLTIEVRPNPFFGIRPLPKEKKARQLLEKCLDYGKIEHDFTIRNRRPGDRFSLRARGVTKPVKQLFNEAGIPKNWRSRVAIVECSGSVCWIEGFGPSADTAVTPETGTVVVLSVTYE